MDQEILSLKEGLLFYWISHVCPHKCECNHTRAQIKKKKKIIYLRQRRWFLVFWFYCYIVDRRGEYILSFI